jgi:hypothetical protein
MSTYRMTCAADRNLTELPRALQRLFEPTPIHRQEFQLLQIESWTLLLSVALTTRGLRHHTSRHTLRHHSEGTKVQDFGKPYAHFMGWPLASESCNNAARID